MNKNQPRLLQLYSRTESEGERHATWLELFFDLVFVVAIAELAHLLHGDLTWTGIVSFAALFIPVWWLWIDFSYYADQFNVERGYYRLTMLAVMLGVIVLALKIPEALHGGSVKFAIVYTILRFIIIALYVQAWRLVSQSRELTARYSISFSIAFVFWFLSIFVPEPIRYWLWAIALLIEISNGPITYATIRNVPTQVSHMDERFGLFVIIVLGEAILAVVTGIDDVEFVWQGILTALSGFIAAVTLWWMYFERADSSVINLALRGNRNSLLRSYVYGYSHVFVFMGIVATGVGIQLAIEATSVGSLTPEMRTIVCGGVALYLLSLTAVQWASPRSLPQSVMWLRGLAAFISVAFIGLGQAIAPFVLVSLLMAMLVSLAAFETLSVRQLAGMRSEE